MDCSVFAGDHALAGQEQLWTFFAEMPGGGLGSVANGNQHAMTAMNCFEPCVCIAVCIVQKSCFCVLRFWGR